MRIIPLILIVFPLILLPLILLESTGYLFNFLVVAFAFFYEKHLSVFSCKIDKILTGKNIYTENNENEPKLDPIQKIGLILGIIGFVAGLIGLLYME